MMSLIRGPFHSLDDCSGAQPAHQSCARPPPDLQALAQGAALLGVEDQAQDVLRRPGCNCRSPLVRCRSCSKRQRHQAGPASANGWRGQQALVAAPRELPDGRQVALRSSHVACRGGREQHKEGRAACMLVVLRSGGADGGGDGAAVESLQLGKQVLPGLRRCTRAPAQARAGCTGAMITVQ